MKPVWKFKFIKESGSHSKIEISECDKESPKSEVRFKSYECFKLID
jgi:hypothetical protein